MWAGVAAVRLGERRLLETIRKYGKSVFLSALETSMDHAERISRSALGRLPSGRLTLDEPQDDGSVFKVAIELSESGMVVDLRDNPDSLNGPGNICRDATEIAAQMVFKSITDSASPANGGTFRPLSVLTRSGSLFDATSPAAVGFYFETLIRVHDLILRCIAPPCPELVCAGTFSSNCVTLVGGVHPVTGRAFTLVEPELGGWGATSDRDGNSAVFSGIHGDTFNCPVEVIETRYGVYVDRLQLNPEPAGDGEHRGGRGIVLEYQLACDGGFMTCGYSRSKVLPWGLEGGGEGSPNYVEVVRQDGDSSRYSFVSSLPVNKGDVVRVVTGNGAGFGDPARRNPDAVRRDARNGFISAEHAKEIYGIDL